MDGLIEVIMGVLIGLLVAIIVLSPFAIYEINKEGYLKEHGLEAYCKEYYSDVPARNIQARCLNYFNK